MKNVLEQYPDYKGLLHIQSKISFRPDILFIGINPGEGAFNELNYNKQKGIRYPNRLLSNPKHYETLDLDWLKTSGARNSFPKQMLDILYQVAKYKFNVPFNIKSNEHQEKFINEITNKIVYTNICPIATKSTKELKKIYKKLSKEDFFKDGKNVANFFRQRTIDLILLIEPKIIVCAGNSVHKDLFLKKILKKEKVFSSSEILKRQDIKYKFEVVTFSRKGAWDIKKISNLIFEKQVKI